MLVAPMHPEEALRQYTLDCLDLLDTAADAHLDTLVRVAQTMFGVETVLISLIDRDRQWFKARQGLDISETPRDVSFCSHTILQTDSLIVPDALHDPRFSDNPLVLSAPRVRLYAGHPLFVNGFPIGSLCLLHPQPRQLSDTEQGTLRDLATLAEGYVVQRVQNTHIRTLYEALDVERMNAMTDPLTRVWNRQGLEYFAPVLFNKVAEGKQVGVLCCDLDHFKTVNDRYGHAIGDQVLVQTARRLKAVLRADDLLVRLGGEEFAMLVLINQTNELQLLAERVRLTLLAEPMPCGEASVSITASVGAAIKRNEETIEVAFSRADLAMYRAKQGGRNRIEMA
ncbi:sensor domain-containing diguanylate cyclase [Stutzerimonas zhaodongensis]|uniref:Sensor domain-containing diguanylate cyclase n=1 Tax=Stutzerimonas zhaodongensis TaxID=1176257 RepID=A0A3M2HV87_9GAMM|nr:sensor domain-containing diguanylate cyclase [Stutzerimonas zhaodongensis]MCQ2029544.1 sensor domain-containing diguanylate cyclase [Stutzerimonas zhaodongensis]MCQ4316236.1 sensor domain-containing diguanylate cyclase [Stutzerimonas zhaodongensis]RMH89714.1 sensor domain-containing diguanylate cyclase [Stutzerimonas zhaodongensis]